MAGVPDEIAPLERSTGTTAIVTALRLGHELLSPERISPEFTTTSLECIRAVVQPFVLEDPRFGLRN